MHTDLKLCGTDIYLRKLVESDVSERYVGWLNDPETTRYMECRFSTWTIELLGAYVRQRQNPNEYFFAICLKGDNRHIGSAKLGPISVNHLTSDIGLLIGDKSCWGKGIGTEVIRLVTEFAFREIQLRKLIAGAYLDNIASIKAFEKCGYSREGYLKGHLFSDGKMVDALLFGYTASDFARRRDQV